MARTTGNASDLITFTRASTGMALTKVAYGPELVTNGGFDTTSDWVLPVGASISNGTVVLENVGTGQQIYQSYALPVGVYEYTFDLVSITSGAIQPYIHGAVGGTGTVRGTVGTYTEMFAITTAGSRIAFRPNGTTSAVVDNVSVKEVLFNDPTGTLKLISHPTNKPRVEYDANGVAKGLLIEEARTNLVTYSDTSVSWTQTVDITKTSNYGAGPDGNTSSIRIQKPSDSGTSSYFNTGLAISGGTANKTFTVSCWAKGTGKFQLKNTHGGVIDSFSSDIDATPNWTRYEFTVTNSSIAGNGLQYVGLSWNSTDSKASVVDIEIFGFQLEQGFFATSYIPTSGATATRSADVAQVFVSDFGYNDAQGTVVVEFEQIGLDASEFPTIVSLDDGSFAERHILYTHSNGNRYLQGAASGATIYGYSFGTTAFNQKEKWASAFAANDFAGCCNGGAVQTDTSGAMTTGITTLNLGRSWNQATNGHLSGYIKSINYYPLRLSDAKLQELTS